MVSCRVALGLIVSLCVSVAAHGQTSTFAWKNVNIQGMGYVTGLVIHPLAPHDIYIRTDVGGAYRYDRAAGRWLPLLDRFGTADSAFGVESIAVDPNDANTVYAAVAMNRVYTATGGGYYNETTWGEVLVSHSRGAWWTKTGMPPVVYMGPNDSYRGTTGERLAVDPVRPGVVYFASRQNGLWRLDASGWAQLGGGMPASGTSPGITFVLAAKTLYAGVYGSGVWASADGGASWTSIGGAANPVRAVLGPEGTLVVTYGGDEGATAGSVGRYQNGSWKDITPLGLFAAYSGVSFDPTGSQLAVAQNGGRNVFYSADQGDSWQRVPVTGISAQPPYYPLPTAANYYGHAGDWGNAALMIDPAEPTRLFQTNGYGVIDTEDFTAAAPVWSWKMQNLEELGVQDIKVPPLVTLPGSSEPGADLFSAAADMIGFRHASRDAVPTATIGTVVYVAQSTSLTFSASKPQYMAWVGWDEAAGWQAVLTGYSSDNGKTWTPFASTSPGSAGKIAMSATDPNRLVWAPTHAATPQYSTDGGHTWQVCTVNGNPLPGSWQLTSEWWNGGVLAADGVDGNRFYFYNNGLFYSSVDGGVTWQAGNATWPTTLPVPYTILVNIVPNPVRAGDVWVSMAANQNEPGRFPLFHSTDGGQTFSAVASADSANFVAFGKGADAGPAIYIHGRAGGATTDAIYRSLDLGASWTPVSDPTQQQFGNIAVLEGDMRQADLVYVGTGGRGIFYGYGPALSQNAPSFAEQSVSNAASYQGGGVAPGEVVTVFGQGLGPSSLVPAALDETGSLSTMLQGAQLFFDGEPAPLIYASWGQAGAVVPYSVAGNSTTSVQASYLGALSLPVVLPVVPTVPGIFTLSASGSGAGTILNEDYSVNSPSNAAARGDYILIYATGEGETAPSGIDGLITLSLTLLPLLPVTVQIDGIDATVEFAGEAPGIVAGVLQVNAQIPAGAHPGPSVPVVIKVAGVASQPGVTVAVK
jgi:xyloglucan-specific exo-beta-1,4-glucanase